jgi:energy-coupling factor transport system ATP-binding protein
MDDLAENARRVAVLNGAKLIMDGEPYKVFLRGGELKETGLGLPVVAKMASMLRERGKNVPEDVIKMDDFERCVEGMLKRRIND